MDVDRWLKKEGFKDHPFAKYEAGKENDLPHYFVPPPEFNEIHGRPVSPQSTVVFAPKGCGKSALRVMVNHKCKNGDLYGKALSVLHFDFEPVVISAKRNPEKIAARYHVIEIIRRAVIPLVEIIIVDEAALNKYKKLSVIDKLYLRWFVTAFGNYLTLHHKNHLSQKGLKLLQPDKPPLSDSRIYEHLAIKEKSPAVDLLNHFSSLLKSIGFDSIYILIDCIDEFRLSACDLKAAVHLIEPLVANIRLLDLPRVAFKFFLPQNLDKELITRHSIRHDRIDFRNLEWSDEQLIEMLYNRLQYYGKYPAIEYLCTHELRHKIEKEMIALAVKSPRNLILLGNFLFSEHSASIRNQQQNNNRISILSWEKAKKRFRKLQEINQEECKNPNAFSSDDDIFTDIL